MQFSTHSRRLIKRMCIVATALAILACMFCISFAAAATPEALLGEILGTIFDIVRYAGVVMLVYGVVILVLAMRNEDSDSKNRAILYLISAVAMIFLKNLFSGIFSLTGVNIKLT